jgi:hypothetical protein
MTEMNEPLAIGASTVACEWDGTPVDGAATGRPVERTSAYIVTPVASATIPAPHHAA